VVSALSLHGVGFAWPAGPRAVEGIDLDVARGDLVALIGPNGAGKTTLLRLGGGLLRPDHGSVRLFGEDPLGLSPRRRARRVAWIPQTLPALPEVRVRDFVLGGRYAHGGLLGGRRADDARAVGQALDEADVADLAERPVPELSGGQRQRVLVARALAQRADLLLFDEPTAALDPEHRVHVFALIERLVRQGRAALVATHELNLASRYADRVVLLDEGRTRALGPPERVLRPSVLGPIYGRHLLFGRAPGPPRHRLVLAWPRPDEP
jgi:iron complex transport system ATP-binding protein